MSAYENLMAYDHDTQALAQIAGRLGWDQETVMPRGAAPQRAEEMAALETVLHARRTDPRVGDWLAALKGASLDPVAAANLREITRSYDRASKVPAQLAATLARVTSAAQGKWAEAREADDYAAFAPVLSEVIDLKREEGAALAAGGDIYDAMLADYEPGTTAADLKVLLCALRPALI